MEDYAELKKKKKKWRESHNRGNVSIAYNGCIF